MIFFMPRVGSMLSVDLNAGWLRAMPSVWFLGLYDVVGGRPASGAASLAATAILATTASVAAAVGLLVSTHGRLTRLALESRETKHPRGRAIAWAVNALTTIFCPQPVARAIFEFTLRTLARSRSHRLLLSMYVGIALALVASAVVPTAIRSGLAGFGAPGVEVLSAPLVIGFFSLIGIRVALAIPVEPLANWVIRLHEPEDRTAAMDGVCAAMLVAGVLPPSLLALASAGALWGAWPALVHTTVCSLMGLILVEILLLRLAKIPFTCTYFPGKSRVGTLWPLYLTAFITYAYTTASVELLLLREAQRFAIFSIAAVLIIAALSLRRRRRLPSLQGFQFQEEAPNTMFEGFHLSEGLAARGAARNSRTEP